MVSKSTSYCVVFLFAGLLTMTSACGSTENGNGNPAGPSNTTTTPPPSNSTAGLKGAVKLTVNPNPVPFSGKPITDVAGCARRNNTWYYELILEETGGAPVTFHSQIDAFDGFVVNNLSGLKISVPARGSVTLNPRWCSATAAKHTSQHTFTGTDVNGNAMTIQSPLVNLMAPGK